MNTILRILSFALVLFLVSCSPAEDALGDKLRVTTTIGQLADITKEIGGAYVEVQPLMGPGVDPHLYKASAGDVKKLTEADLIIVNGLHLEAKMGEVLEHMPEGRVISVGERLDEGLLRADASFGATHDPHIWFNVRLMMQVTGHIRDALIEKDPLHADIYTENAEAYVQKLENLDAYVRVKVQEVTQDQRILVTAHDAFHYFGDEYGFEVVGLQGISTQAEAGTKDVQDLVAFIVDKKIKAVFVESSVPIRNIQAVQDSAVAKGWDVAIGGQLFSDAMGDEGTFEGTYIGMVTHNVDTIVAALK